MLLAAGFYDGGGEERLTLSARRGDYVQTCRLSCTNQPLIAPCFDTLPDEQRWCADELERADL
jgi:hypothetical protein